jgi:hypothetical protein
MAALNYNNTPSKFLQILAKENNSKLQTYSINGQRRALRLADILPLQARKLSIRHYYYYYYYLQLKKLRHPQK